MMSALPVAPLAVGAPAWPSTSGGWDWWLIAGILVAVVLIPRLLGLRRSPGVLVTCLLAAVLLATTVDVWGVPAAAALTIAASLALMGFTAAQRRRPPPV